MLTQTCNPAQDILCLICGKPAEGEGSNDGTGTPVGLCRSCDQAPAPPPAEATRIHRVKVEMLWSPQVLRGNPVHSGRSK